MRIARLLAIVLFAACGIRNPVKNSVIIEPDADTRHVTVTAKTDIIDSGSDATERERINEMRTSLLEHRDEWTPRFAALNAFSEHIAFDKTDGALRHAEHSVKISTEDLPRLLGDLGTVQLSDSEHWMELAFYPTASTRATRQQRDHVEEAMKTWSRDAVRYFRALDALYLYLNAQPQRATPVFTILFSDNEDEHSTIEEEDALITAVSHAMTTIIRHVDDAKRAGVTLDEEFDLVFNPLPGEIVVRVPGPILAFEGFERRDERTAAIPRAGLIDAVRSLEGKWVSPDPLAILGHSDESNTPIPKPEEIAARPRHSSATVTVEEVQTALIARLKPAGTFRVRWGN